MESSRKTLKKGNCLRFLRKRSKGGNRTSSCYLSSSQLKLFQRWRKQEPMNCSEQLLCTHVTAFSLISLFLEWFFANLGYSTNQLAEPKDQKMSFFNILITLGLVFLFHILHFECAHRRRDIGPGCELFAPSYGLHTKIS